MHWFTSDLHIGHKNVIKYTARPFETVDNMDAALLGAWRKVLKRGDFLSVVGDLAISKRHALRALDALPQGVQLYYIFGNHERDFRNAIRAHERVTWSGDIKEIKIEGQTLILFHYAMRTWSKSPYGSWSLYGHSHGELDPLKGQLDVGVDSAFKLVGEYRPLSFDEIKQFIQV